MPGPEIKSACTKLVVNGSARETAGTSGERKRELEIHSETAGHRDN